LEGDFGDRNGNIWRSKHGCGWSAIAKNTRSNL